MCVPHLWKWKLLDRASTPVVLRVEQRVVEFFPFEGLLVSEGRILFRPPLWA